MKLAVGGMQQQSCVSFFMCGFQGSQISYTCWWLDLEFISKSTGNYNLFVHRCLRHTIPRTRNVLDLLCYQPMIANSTSSLVEVHHDLPQAVWLDVLLFCAAFWSHPWLFRPCICRTQHQLCDIQSLLSALSSRKYRRDIRRSQQHQAFREVLPVLVHRW